jgi:IS5 family transposase
MAAIAKTAVKEAQRVAANARHTLRQLGDAAPRKLLAIAEGLEVTAARVEQIATQTCQRIGGTTPDGATRLVSLHDPDARPIRKGRLGKPVEFGYKAQVVDNEDGVVVDHNVEIGNPPDGPMLVPAIERVAARANKVPKAVTADRGYGDAVVRDAVVALGVTTVVLPTRGKPNASQRALEQKPAFQRLVKWRTGSEGRISCLKRDFGWNRTQIDGLAGARIWCGQGVFNHNLVKIAALIDTK